MRDHLTNILGAATSLLGAITARQQEFEYWFRQFGTLVAVVVGLATLWSIFFRKTKNARRDDQGD